MQPIFSTDSIKQIELAWTEQHDIEMFELMSRAGRAAFDLLVRHWPQAEHIVVATGAGNNAGDGLVLAKLANEAGYKVSLVALKGYHDFSGDSLKAWKQLEPSNLSIEYLDKEKDKEFDSARELLDEADLIVDALLGTGLKGSLRDNYLAIINLINQVSTPVLSLDIPSGIYADSGLEAETCVQAEHTASFILPKLAQVVDEGLAAQGKCHIADLGLSSSLNRGNFFQQKPLAYYYQLIDVADLLPKRKANTYKNECGHLLSVGGSSSMGGAIILSAETALRSGSGMVTCLLDESNKAAALSRCPEVMWQSYKETSVQLEQQLILKHDYNSIVIGPGLGRSDWSQKLYQWVLKYAQQKNISLIIDADGLYFLAKNPALNFGNTKLIVTPHIGEAAHLLSLDTASIKQNRLDAAKKIANKYNAICVLKGAGTVISDGEKVMVAGGAHSAMATSGLGDVLAGLIGALLAQGVSTWNAALLAVAIHFESGVNAAKGRTRGMLASEIIDEINLIVSRY